MVVHETLEELMIESLLNLELIETLVSLCFSLHLAGIYERSVALVSKLRYKRLGKHLYGLKCEWHALFRHGPTS